MSVVIKEGDFFERPLPNGSKEYYRVEDKGFFRGDVTIPDHHQAKVVKANLTEMKNVIGKSRNTNAMELLCVRLFMDMEFRAERKSMIGFVISSKHMISG